MNATQELRWSHHEDRPESEDATTECCRFEALMDPVYGYYNVHRTDVDMTPYESAKLGDTLICQVVDLNEALPSMRRYLDRLAPAK